MPEELPGTDGAAEEPEPPGWGNHISGGDAHFVVQARDIGHVHFPGGGDPLDRAAGELRRMVAVQWKDEAAHQGLFTTAPLGIRWEPGRAELTDHPETVGALPSYASDAGPEALARGFRALPHRRLVVLGPSGSGKTTLAVLLLLALLRHAPDGEPVPVLFSLPGWNPETEHLRVWLARRLAEDYPRLAARDGRGAHVARRLVDSGRVLPVLDGLDELPAPHRAPALRAVSHALAGDQPLVLTCRTAEYESAVGSGGHVLSAAAVVEARPAGSGAVAAYLRASAAPQRAPEWGPVLRALESAGSYALAEAMESAYTVWLARTVYADPTRDPAELLRFRTASAIRAHLADALIPAAYAPGPRALAVDGEGPSVPPPRCSPQQARRWLTFLAVHERRERWRRGGGLAWWQLQHALPREATAVLFTTVVLVEALVCTGLYAAWGHGQGSAWQTALFSLVLLGAFWTYSHRTVPAPWRFDAPVRTWLRLLRRKRLGGVLSGLFVLLGAGMALTPLVPYDADRLSWGHSLYSVKLLAGIGILVVLARVNSIAEPLDVSPRAPSPTDLLRTDRARTVRRLLIWACLGVVFMLVQINLQEWRRSGPADGIYVLLSAFWIALHYAVAMTAWGRWLLARTALALRGDLPWRLLRFLDDAHRRGLLRQRGSRWEFRHAHLQDRLCQESATPLTPRWEPGAYGARARGDGSGW